MSEKPTFDEMVALIWRLTEPHNRDPYELDSEGDIYAWRCAWCGEPVTLDTDDQEQGHGGECAYVAARAIIHRFGKVRGS